MCRGKIVADSGSPNVKLTKMTWNKESFQYRLSYSQSGMLPGHAMRTRSTMKLTRHSKSMRSFRRKFEPKRKQGTVYGSTQREAVTPDTQCLGQVINNVASPEPAHTAPMKRNTTLRRRHAVKRRSEHNKKHLGMKEDPSEITVLNDKQQSDSVEVEGAVQFEIRPDIEHSLDPSQIMIEMSDSIADTLSQSPGISNVEQQLHILHSLETDDEEEVERLDQTRSSDLRHATSTIPTRESISSTSTNDSGISSLNTSLESSASSITTDRLDYPQRQLPRSTGKKPKSSSRGKVRIRRRPRKILVVGDMCSGKSSIVSAYCRDRFTDSYLPTILNCCFSDAEVFGEKIELVLIDVSGRDDYKRLRECAYHKVDAVILCYSIANASSIDSILEKWIPELKKHASQVSYVLVGTKKDLRDDYLFKCEQEEASAYQLSNDMVSTEQGEELAKAIGAQSFHECSALYREGTRDVFETVTKVALRKSRRKHKTQENSSCTIL